MPPPSSSAAGPAQAVSSRHRAFPNPVAVFNERFCFTTLSQKDVEAHGRLPYAHPETGKSVLLFSLDEEMHYTPFSADHGPLNLAFTFRALIKIHDRLERTEARKKPLCLYTAPEPTRKSNMTLIAALFFLIVGRQAPWHAFRPIAPLEIMPFRDAGNGPMDYGLTVQDILYGVDKAMHHGLLDLVTFDQEAYQKYEQVDNGDLNLLGPFIPFASPIELTWIKAARAATKTVSSPGGTLRTTARQVTKAKVTSQAMKCVLEVFEKENVGLVVRLNDELYDRRHFVDMGMDHADMYFHDGSNPTDEIVREFIRLAEDTIERKGQKVAVHCKAGLGRTGVLIGAYLIYKYQFSAPEVIGYMRIVRPGMVVGPQQHYMMNNQMKWAGWAARDQLLRELAEEKAAPEPFNPLATPPTEINPLLPANHSLSSSKRDHDLAAQEAIEKLEEARSRSTERSASSAIKPVIKGGDAVGQPRKTPARPQTRSTTRESPIVIAESSAQNTPTRPVMPQTSEKTLRTQESAEVEITTTVPVETASGGSLRGTKRAAGRSAMQALKASPPRVTLAVPVSSLTRCSSNASISSVSSADNDPRPSKKRSPTSSPLARTGLSSPPLSREGSPATPDNSAEGDQMLVDEQLKQDGGQEASSAPSTPVARPRRISNKLRRRVISPSPSPALPVEIPSTPPPTSIPSTQEAVQALAGLATSPPVRSPPKRSFLPVRRNIADHNYLDPKSISYPHSAGSSQGYAATKIKSPEPAHVTLGVASIPKRQIALSKGLRTPPRITEMWGQLAKMGSSSPASGC
ncbi:hypothetical protein I317_05132 [Kwoniella heveanensis CBS 569]|nr:hypothetical protein I317_05132 [Kwoniella heveanensis CBS 569]